MKKKDLTNMRFGKLLVISEGDMYISPKGYRKVQWNCLCDCGNKTIVMASHLLSGHTCSCGCDKLSKLKPRCVEDIVGKKFGLLTVIKRLPNRMIGSNSRVNWLCKCECGNYNEVLGLLLRQGQVKSCGCLNISYGEKFMIEFLERYNISYIHQYSSPDLIGVGGGLLKFDFAIFDKYDNLILLIELNGLQHYQSVDYFGGKRAFEIRCKNDRLKRLWCKTKHIDLKTLDISKCLSESDFLNLYNENILPFLN